MRVPTDLCLSCGACCAYFRASFYWAEADDATPGGVPVALTEKLDHFRRVMIGTRQRPVRCIALEGEIGRAVRCAIYERRASVCREFTPSFADGRRHPRCDQARQAHGLPPLRPEDWAPRPERAVSRATTSPSSTECRAAAGR